MLVKGVSHARLMSESEARIERAARSGTQTERLVANRLLGDAQTWRHWESEHARLLKTVADIGSPAGQDRALRIGAFTLIHRRAPFEYLRDNALRGEARRLVVAQFHSTAEFAKAMVAEHGQYLRSAGSFLCAQYLGSKVYQNGVFLDPMQRYQELYREYFAAFCGAALARQNGASAKTIAAQESLLPLLKYELARLRQSILALPQRTPELIEDALLLQPTGDTVRIKQPC